MKKRSGKFSLSKNTVITLALAVVALVLLSVYALSQSKSAKTTTVTPQPSASVPMGGHGPNTTVAAGPSHDTTPSATPTTISNPSHPVSNTLAPPTGDLLSSHSVSLTDCKASGCQEDSTCNTVAGATCYIEATNDSGKTVVVSKTVTANASGGADILWDAGQLGVGNWMIRAVAQSNGSQGTSDADTLAVKS